jgi:hypothetical protein
VPEPLINSAAHHQRTPLLPQQHCAALSNAPLREMNMLGACGCSPLACPLCMITCYDTPCCHPPEGAHALGLEAGAHMGYGPAAQSDACRRYVTLVTGLLVGTA